MKHLEYSILSKEFIFLLLIGVLPLTCLAQKDFQIDSLLNILQTHKEDSNKVKTLNALSRQYWQKANYKESEKYACDALSLAEKVKYKHGKVTAFYNMGIVYTFQDNYQKALDKFFNGLRLSERIGYKKGMADSYNGIAGIYNRQGNFSEALKTLINFNSIMQEIGH